MKDIVSCKLSNGIGKQLFQIGAVIYYSKKYNKYPVFQNTINSLVTDKVDVLSDHDFQTIKFKNHIERVERSFNDLPEYNENVMLQGSFQAFQYITKEVFIEIQHMIYNNEDYMYKAYEEYNKIKNHFKTENDDDLISIHVRARNNTIDDTYYNKAFNIKDIDKLYPVVFSPNIDLCKKQLGFIKNAYFVDTGNTCVDFILMSFFKNNIIDNSFFGWWAAFISNYDEKIVITPSIWEHSGVDDLYPPGWIIV